MNDLVSVIITTKNEESVIENILKSIRKQSYKPIETLVIDNNSNDRTKEIAKSYTSLVFNKGDERSAQRNFGGEKAKGKYLFFLDADMILGQNVIGECVSIIEQKKAGGVIVPEQTRGIGFWSKVKAYERSFYVGDDTIEAARFYPKDAFLKLGKYDETMTGPEDWDFSQRVKKAFGLARIQSYIIHDEGKINLPGLMKKKYYYAKSARNYLLKNNMRSFSPQTVFFLRKSFYNKPEKIFKHPILFIAMVFMLFLEIFAGLLGYFSTANK